jgi:outer membrane receptor protein involved in Fe transport
MKSTTTLGSLLLLSTALAAGPAWAGDGTAGELAGLAQAQDAQQVQPAPVAPPEETPEETPEEDVEVSVPGASPRREIVVTGRRIPNVVRATPEVVSVLSAADIARAGDGDVAGALQRVTGLSVVGGRFVYVRGLGERYSLALLNGLPLPSPEPLRRTVPLDLFPSDILASSLVQKSYSVNYPGEFGGGVINLTTKSIPRESFLDISGSIGGNTVTTGQLGYTYFGSPTDRIGFDDGTRDVPARLAAALRSGNLVSVGPNFPLGEMKAITKELVNARTTLIQRNFDIPADFSLSASAGTSFDVGDSRIGVIATAGWDNGWRTKGGLQQLAAGVSLVEGKEVLLPDQDFRFLSTENRVVVNGLLGVGAEIGDHVLRWTGLFIRDTLKEARIQDGTDNERVGSTPINRSFTSWFERQLWTTQAVGEFEFGDLSLDLRGAYANSKRRSPYERAFGYRFDETLNKYTNDLRANGAFATIAFSRLVDEVWGGGFDLGYKLPTERPLTLQAGYSYTDNVRTSSRRDFRYLPRTALPITVSQQRPDALLSDFNVEFYDIILTETSGAAGAAVYDAGLKVHGAYAQFETEPVERVRITGGVRYERGDQFVEPIDLFGLGGSDIIPTRLNNDYWLPAGTITWNFAEDMQLRLSAGKTIARPQFRELAPQFYLDTESDRTSFGNQFLIDSQLVNADARWEWYFGREQRLTVGAFWKRINNPIEAIAFRQGNAFFQTFANAPKARLYGAELEAIKYWPLEDWTDNSLLAARRIYSSFNYTYTDSRISVSDGDLTIVPGSGGRPQPASDVFRDGQPLTGQSDHLINLQVGLQATEGLSEQTFLLTYASRRVTNRGSQPEPDFIEVPGIRLDFVARQGIDLFGVRVEAKFEARNLTGTDYQEIQELNGSRIDLNTYRLGRSFSFGITTKF